MTQVRLSGLDELRRGLRQAHRDLPKAVGRVNEKIAQEVVDKARPLVKALPSPGGTKAMSGLRASKRQDAAAVLLLGRNPTIRANVFGTLSHTVFGRRVGGRGPWLPWVGNTWKPEDLYGLGPAIKDVADDFALDEYLDAVLVALKPAFPD